MPVIMVRRNEKGRLLEEWKGRCGAVLAGLASREDLRWLDHHIAQLHCFMSWLDLRRKVLHRNEDPNEVRELQEIDARQTDAWHSVIAHGFEHTVRRSAATDRAKVLRELAAILYDPEALDDLEFAIFSAETLPARWAQLQAETGRGIEPRLFLLQSGVRVRVWRSDDGGSSRPTVEAHVEADEIDVHVVGLREHAGQTVDAALMAFNADEVYAQFPVKPAKGTRSDAISAGSWKRCRAAAEASLNESESVVIDDQGKCAFRLVVPANSHPLADKVLAIVIGYKESPPRR